MLPLLAPYLICEFAQDPATSISMLSENPGRCATKSQRILGVVFLFALCFTTAAPQPALAAGTDYAPSLAGGIANGDFEQGRTGWTEYSKVDWPLIYDEDDLIVTPHSGRWAAWLAGADDEISYIEQTVDVPMGGPSLTYWLWVSSMDECDADDDSGEVRIEGAVVDTLRLCKGQNTPGWQERTVDLSTYAGQTVDLQIRAETNGAYNSDLFIDDVSVVGNEQTLTLMVGIVGQGGVDQTPDPPYYDGDDVKLTPKPDGGWIFDGWSGPDAAGLVDNNGETWSLTMDGNKAVTATFLPLRLFLPLVVRSQ